MDNYESDNRPIFHIIEVELPFPIWITVLVAVSTSCCFICCTICICQRIQRMVRRSQRKDKSVIQYDPMPSYLGDMKTRLVQPGHSDDQDSPTDFGRLQFSLQYDIEDNKLYVSVLQCTQLLKNVTGRLPDPYVKVYLHPDLNQSTRPLMRRTQSTQDLIARSASLLDMR